MGAVTSKWRGTQPYWYDKTSYETVLPISPTVYEEDFFVDKQSQWTAKDSGGASEAMVADQNGGVYSLNLDATDEKQYGGLTWGDERPFNLDKGPVIEFRVAVHTAPSGQAELYFGLINDWVEGPYAEADAGATVHALFLFDGSLACKIFTDDGSTDNDAVATGITVVADEYHVFLIDASDVTNVKFYIDRVQVATGTTFVMSNGSNVMLQPFIEVHKETGTGVGSLYVDYIKVWMGAR